MESFPKFYLNFPEFQSNMASQFRKSLQDEDFCDVTLVCEDGHQIVAHRVIISASSEVFKLMLKRNNHPHTMVLLRGVKEQHLSALLDYIYDGEVSIMTEDLEDFLDLGNDLQIKGLIKENKELQELVLENVHEDVPRLLLDTKKLDMKQKTKKD